MLQKTISSSASCEGTGIHTGNGSQAVFHPAQAGSGIIFISGGKKVPAKPQHITDTKRGTTLDGISTVEHVLSAVYGLGIDNIIIEIAGGEPPILDGSSAGYTELLLSAGITEQKMQRTVIKPPASIHIKDGPAEISLFPSDRLIIEARIVYPEAFVGTQSHIFDETLNDYRKDIAPARTFGRLSEVEALKKQGLAKGASFENAIAITEDGYSAPLRFPDELARHKILDIMGDIAFAGARLAGRIVSVRAGHKLNIELVRRIINAS